MKITLPSEVSDIISALEKEGFEAYAVGGCIRDAILQRTPNDWDITTNALPEEIKRIFPVTIDTGIAHGTVTVRKNKKSYEVTTYRIDGEYLDSRHPETVTFTRELKEDLRRRDFTINAMAYNDKVGLVDEFGGISDLKDGIIRCVEDPDRRFTEDALRMLRAVRFVAQLGFALEKNTEKSIRKHAPTLSKISVERICDELIKTITTDRPETIFLMYDMGLTDVFFPEWKEMVMTKQNTKHHRGNVAEHTVFVMQGVPKDKIMRLAALLHDVGKPVSKKVDEKGTDHFVGHPQVGAKLAKSFMRRLKLDNYTIDRVCRFVKFHDDRPQVNPRNVRRCMNRMGEDLFPDIFVLRHADIMGQSHYKREEKLREIEDFKACYQEIIQNRDCISLKNLAITGGDVISLGVPKGPKVGKVLKQALEVVIESPEKNTREILTEFVKETLND